MLNYNDAKVYYQQREQKQYQKREAERLKWLKQVQHAIKFHAPQYLGIKQVYLFGSLVKPGRFSTNSDIDIAINCDNLETESSFWKVLEKELQRDVDLRPLVEPIKEVIIREGEKVYEQ